MKRIPLALIGTLTCLLTILLLPQSSGRAQSHHPDQSNDLYLPLLLDQPPSVTRVSVASNGTQGNEASRAPSISAHGRFVAFHSWASNLVPNDTNKSDDVFVHDRKTGETNRVSLASDGTEGNAGASSPSISADGRFVAFTSVASNLVLDDTNDFCGLDSEANCADIFVHDRQTGETSRVSLASDGTEGNDNSFAPTISGDGRFVAFTSEANNLVFDDTNGSEDIFVHDRQTGETSRVSLASDGSEGNGDSREPAISGNGRFVAFTSEANNLAPNISNYSCGTLNNCSDIFVHDRETGETSRVSLASDGTEGDRDSWNPAISDEGRFVAFTSAARTLVPDDTNVTTDIFVHDRQTGETSRVSLASDGTEGIRESAAPAISGDGRFVAFQSAAGNLVPDDTDDFYDDIFVRDRKTGETSRVSLAVDGAEGNGPSSHPAISADGRFVAYHSLATNLVPGDTNAFCTIWIPPDTSQTINCLDGFVHYRGAQ